MANGRGFSLSKAVIGGILGTAAVAGLSIGISVESQKSSVLNNKIDELRNELYNTDMITQSINVTPPKGFINAR